MTVSMVLVLVVDGDSGRGVAADWLVVGWSGVIDIELSSAFIIISLVVNSRSSS